MMGPEAGYHHEDGFHHDGIAWDPLAGKDPPRSEVAPALAGAAVPRTKPKHRQVSHTDR